MDELIKLIQSLDNFNIKYVKHIKIENKWKIKFYKKSSDEINTMYLTINK